MKKRVSRIVALHQHGTGILRFQNRLEHACGAASSRFVWHIKLSPFFDGRPDLGDSRMTWALTDTFFIFFRAAPPIRFPAARDISDERNIEATDGHSSLSADKGGPVTNLGSLKCSGPKFYCLTTVGVSSLKNEACLFASAQRLDLR